MLIAALLAGHDPEAQPIFDGLYRYDAGDPSAAHPGLMAWAQDAACADVQGADSATDGGLDIAYALLLADRQWGSTGAVDYATTARTVIAASLAAEVHPAGSILAGDWADATDSHYTGTRPSDFMTGHFRAFAALDPRWMQVADHTYATVAYLQAHAAAQTPRLPRRAGSRAPTTGTTATTRAAGRGGSTRRLPARRTSTTATRSSSSR